MNTLGACMLISKAVCKIKGLINQTKLYCSHDQWLKHVDWQQTLLWLYIGLQMLYLVYCLIILSEDCISMRQAVIHLDKGILVYFNTKLSHQFHYKSTVLNVKIWINRKGIE